ncbi:MAG: hypothetical protein ACLRWA_00790 [Lachnospira sp.]
MEIQMSLRSLMEFKFPEDGGIPIEEVEGVDSIVRRFKTRCYVLWFYFSGGT